MSKKVLLIHPKRGSVRAYGLPHVGLASLAAVLKHSGSDILVVDYLLTPDAPAVKYFLKSFSPDIVGISAYTAMVGGVFRLIEAVHNYDRMIPVIVGGPHASLYPEDFTGDNRVSYIMQGESEERIGEIIATAIKENSPKLISCRPVDMQKLPFPEFNCFYGYEKIINYPLSTARGCPYRCSFCIVSALSSGKYRWKEAGACCQEVINAQKSLPNLKCVSVIDDNPAGPKERFRDFLLQYPAKINLPLGFASLRADAIDDEILTLIKKAKTRSVCLAVEHADLEVYQHINKGEELDDVIKAADLVKRHNLGLDLCFIIGLPYDTFEKTRRSVELAKQLGAKTIYWNMLIPYKGTAVREWFLEHGRLFGENGRSSYVDYSCFCDEPAAETDQMSAQDRKKAYFYAMLESNNYVLRIRDVFKDLPRLFITAHRYGLYKTLLKNLIFQLVRLPVRLGDRIMNAGLLL